MQPVERSNLVLKFLFRFLKGKIIEKILDLESKLLCKFKTNLNCLPFFSLRSKLIKMQLSSNFLSNLFFSFKRCVKWSKNSDTYKIGESKTALYRFIQTQAKFQSFSIMSPSSLIWKKSSSCLKSINMVH